MKIDRGDDILVKCKHNIKDKVGDSICDINLTYNLMGNLPACKLSRDRIGDIYKCDEQKSFYVSWTAYILNSDKLLKVGE